MVGIEHVVNERVREARVQVELLLHAERLREGLEDDDEREVQERLHREQRQEVVDALHEADKQARRWPFALRNVVWSRLQHCSKLFKCDRAANSAVAHLAKCLEVTLAEFEPKHFYGTLELDLIDIAVAVLVPEGEEAVEFLRVLLQRQRKR